MNLQGCRKSVCCLDLLCYQCQKRLMNGRPEPQCQTSSSCLFNYGLAEAPNFVPVVVALRCVLIEFYFTRKANFLRNMFLIC
jgi:hypothetical protein